MKKLTLLIILFSALIFHFSCKKKTVEPAITFSRPFKRALWVVRYSIGSKKKADEVIRFAKENRIDTLVIQIRGRGDAYYKSTFEPTAPDVEKNFDPLAYLIEQCRTNRIEMHAWMNVIYAADVNARTPEPNHILSLHPEWVNFDRNGNSMFSYSNAELRDNLLEGTFVDPGVPDVVAHLVNVARDLVTRYNMDGLHFDFIRYPWSGFNGYYKKFLQDFGYNPEARLRFMEQYGIDPVDTTYKRATPGRELWRDFRRNRINEVVRRCYQAVKAVRPSIKVSAAVIPNAPVVRNAYFQDWKRWVKEGYLDVLFPMSYDEGMYNFRNYIRIASETRDKIPTYMGIIIKKNSKITVPLRQIQMIYHKGFVGFCIFSYDDGQPQIREITGKIIDNRR